MKKIFAIAFLAAAFIACSKDDDNNNDSPKLPEKQAPYILYFDAESKTIAAGQWGKVNAGNALYFKFGSVVGFTTTRSNDNWGRDDVKFDPSENSANYGDYNNIPYYEGADQPDGYISSAVYHYGENVKDGMGDPCRLVGLKASATAREIDAHDSGLRLPEVFEFWDIYIDAETFIWTTESGGGRWLAANPTMETFLPMAYFRNNIGNPDHGIAAYWTADPFTSTNESGTSENGGQLQFDRSIVRFNYGFIREYGFPIRCVRN